MDEDALGMRRRQMFAEASHDGASDQAGTIPIVAPENLTEEAIPEHALVPDPHACPTCGKVVKRGMYFHKKYCKG